MKSFNIDEFNYKIKASILLDIEDDTFEDKGLSWLHSENKKSLIKTVSKNKDTYVISFKNKTWDIYNSLKEYNNIFIGCICNNKLYKLECRDIQIKDACKNNQSLNLILNDKFKVHEKSHLNANIDFEEVNIDFNSWINYNDENKRIENLATVARIESEIGKFITKNNFINWYKEYKPKRCCYCGIEEEDLKMYFNEQNKQYFVNEYDKARQRGKFLEIERIVTAPKDKNVYSIKNCALACYICNNAKSDFLSTKSFKPIAKGINIFWNKVMNKDKDLTDEELFDLTVKFPETDIWEKE